MKKIWNINLIMHKKNKFLYNIDPPKNDEGSYDSDNVLDDGATDGENFRNLMEYQ